MTTPTQKGKAGDPTKDPGRGSGNMEVTVEIKLAGTKAHVSADYATIVAASFVSESVTVTSH